MDDYETLQSQFNRLNGLYYECQKERDSLRCSKWISPLNVPIDFWGECFVGCHIKENNHCSVDPNIVMVKRFGDEVKWFCNSVKKWYDFRNDVNYRVMIITYPKINELDFLYT